MKKPHRAWIAALLLAAIVSSQNPTPADGHAASLARARLLEQHEGDLQAAERAYRGLLGQHDAAAVHPEAALRLGSLLWRIDRQDAARPFLERAAAAGGELGTAANEVLQGQGDAQKQAQERLARAKALVDRIDDLVWTPRHTDGDMPGATQQTLDAAIRDLEWLGEPAALALVQRLDALDAKTDGALKMADGRPVPNVRLFVELLWRMGTPPAQQFLQRAANDGSVDWRRFVTRHAEEVSGDLQPGLVLFLRDPDPTGEVPRNLERHLHKLPLATLVQLLGEDHVGSRAGGLGGLAGVWGNLGAEERLATFGQIEAAVRRALQDTAVGVSRPAWRLVGMFASHGPRPARRFVLAEVARYPDGFGAFVQSHQQIAWPLDDAELALFVHSAPARGARRDAGLYRDLEMLWSLHQPEWTVQGLDALLELLERGYGGFRGSDPEWLPRFFELARPEHLVRFVRALSLLSRHDRALQFLVASDLPPDVFEAARDVVEAGLRAEPKDWKFFEVTQGSRQPGRDLRILLQVIGRSRSPAAAAWLATFAQRVPLAGNDVVRALVALSVAADTPQVRTAMRQMLVAKDLDPSMRNLVFAELARLGDEPSIELFPRAYALGLQEVQPEAHGRQVRAARPNTANDPVTRAPFSAKGIGFLGLVDEGSGAPPRPWHGYAQEALETAWRTLLTSPVGGEVWQDLCAPSPSGRSRSIPLPLLPLVVEQLQTRWAAASRDQRHRMQQTVLQVFGMVPTDPQFFSGVWVDALRSLLRAGDAELAQAVFVHLPHAAARQFEAEGKAILRRASSWGFFDALRRSGIELATDDWLWLLQAEETGLRKAVLASLPGPLDATLRQAVERQFAAEDAGVRAAACETLARLAATDSVPTLLAALRDPTEGVRKAAAAALERLRFEREQQAFWLDAKAGIDTSPASAAGKLLRQAQPQEPKDQRLLAIRSLGVLGAAESLPYLIEWTRDPDAEVAAAARAAAAQIHERAGVKK